MTKGINRCIAAPLTMIFLMISMLAGVSSVFADDADAAFYEIRTARDDHYSYIQVAATEAMDTLGFAGDLDIDRKVFKISGLYVKDGFSFTGNIEEGIFAIDAAEPVTLSPGEILFTMQMNLTKSADPSQVYPISLKITEAYGEDMENYDWVPANLEGSYCYDQAEIIDFQPDSQQNSLFTVTYEDEDGEILSIQSVDPEDPYAVPFEPEKEGYTFQGWMKDGSLFDDTQTITGNTTLTASWTADSEASSEKESDAPTVSSPALIFIGLIVVIALIAVIFLFRRSRKNA